MNGSSGVGPSADPRAALALRLHAVADEAVRAARLADGEYIPQMSRESELRSAYGVAGGAADALVELAPGIASLEGGEDGLRLAQAAIDQLDAGRDALREGVTVQDDLFHGSTVVADAIATGSASASFEEAAGRVRDIAAVADIEATPLGDIYDSITQHPPV